MTRRAVGIIAAVIVVALGIGVAFFALENNLLLSGTYYTQVDNDHVAENEPDGGVVHFKTNEPYLYSLPAVSEKGEAFDVEFGASHKLRDSAYLELRIEPFRGVVAWEEIDRDHLPAAAVERIEQNS